MARSVASAVTSTSLPAATEVAAAEAVVVAKETAACRLSTASHLPQLSLTAAFKMPATNGSGSGSSGGIERSGCGPRAAVVVSSAGAAIAATGKPAPGTSSALLHGRNNGDVERSGSGDLGRCTGVESIMHVVDWKPYCCASNVAGHSIKKKRRTFILSIYVSPGRAPRAPPCQSQRHRVW